LKEYIKSTIGYFKYDSMYIPYIFIVFSLYSPYSQCCEHIIKHYTCWINGLCTHNEEVPQLKGERILVKCEALGEKYAKNNKNKLRGLVEL